MAQPSPTPVEDVEAEGCTLNASFVADIMIPDDTEMAPGASFTKSWRIQNSGTCDWGPGFELVFVLGVQMGSVCSIPLPETVAGGTVDLAIDLQAPTAYGTHRGDWQMRSDEGRPFGSTFWVQIVVPSPATAAPEATPTLDVPIMTMLPPQTTPMIPPFLPVQVEQIYSQISIGSGDIGQATVECPGSSLPVSGGYAAHPDVLVYSHSQHGDGWQAWAKNNAGVSKLLNVYAVCLSNTGGSVTEAHYSVTVEAGWHGTPEVTCPPGSVVTGGGWASDHDGSLQVYGSRVSGNGWGARARNGGGEDKTFAVYAACLSGTSGSTTEVGNGGSVGGHETGA